MSCFETTAINLVRSGGALVRDGRFTWLKQPRYPAGGTRKHGRRNSAPSPKLIQPGSAVSGSAETRLVGKLSASHSQSAYAIYTAAPTAAPYSWNLDCSQEGSQDPGIRERQMRNGRGHGSGKTKRHRRAEVSPGCAPSASSLLNAKPRPAHGPAQTLTNR